MKKKINCIILDDEPFAVKLIEDYASKVPQLQVLYADNDVFKAVEILNTEQVDLIFIDIQMPQLTGIDADV
jgi:two-component system LytT family response regulator